MNGDDTVRVFLQDSARTRWLFTGMALFGAALIGVATGVLMAPWAPLLGDRLGELTCLQLAFTAARADAVLATFGAGEREAIAHLLVPGDLVFALGYGLLLSGLLGLLVLRLPASWQRVGSVLMWAPLAAALLDGVEDAFLYQVNAAATAADAGLAPLLAGLAATLKYLALSVITPAFAVAGSAKGLTVDRSAGALVVYALVVGLGVAMLARPLQQVPACF
jgi:hypothetical protein